MTDLTVRHFSGRDGAPLVYRELGVGRPLVLIHGYFSTATVNWVKYGHAALLADQGHRVVMPDLRGHGDSTTTHDPAAYPPDVLADDGFALVEHLGLTDYDLAGYSLGARTALRMMVRGATPRRAVIAGTGTEGVVDASERGGYYRNLLTHLGTFERGTSQWRAEAFLNTVGGDPVALLRVLDTFVDTAVGELARIGVPSLVVVGEADEFRRSAEELARVLPSATLEVVPGNHMSAVTRPELGAAIAGFLAED